MFYVTILVSMEFLIHVIRQGVDPPIPTLVEERENVDVYQCLSKELRAWDIVILSPKVILTIYTLVCAFRVRKGPRKLQRVEVHFRGCECYFRNFCDNSCNVVYTPE
eukprot:TRINITY_DN9209_c0_g1_i1.p1 TRINITY_DN9209_c0_g1~~TRINITY_DN9209_c0_g1_i1.p1  ORF type:complete len:107 (+),score=7.22 TRINITY_DN9209_c0_g1_i1:346-666(+)